MADRWRAGLILACLAGLIGCDRPQQAAPANGGVGANSGIVASPPPPPSLEKDAPVADARAPALPNAAPTPPDAAAISDPAELLSRRLEYATELFNYLANELAKVKDESSAEAAGPVVHPRFMEVTQLVEETAIGNSPLPRDEYQAIYDRYRKDVEAAERRYLAEKSRLFGDRRLLTAFNRGAFSSP